MGTTTAGLPYPEPTDPVANGAAAIKALAEAVARPWVGMVTAPWSNAAPGTIPFPTATRTIPLVGGQLYLITSWSGYRWGAAAVTASLTTTVLVDGVAVATGQLLGDFTANQRGVVYGGTTYTPAASGNKVITMNIANSLSSIQNGAVQTGWRIEAVQ